MIAAKKARPSDGGSDEVCEPPWWFTVADKALKELHNITHSLVESDGRWED